MIRKSRSYEKIRTRYGYFFIGLWMIGFIFLFIIPFIQAIVYSFHHISVGAGSLNYNDACLDNYRRLFFEDSQFLKKFTGTLSDMLFQTPVILIFSLFVAVLLNEEFKGCTLARAVFFLPVVIMSGPVIDIMNADSFFGELASGAKTTSMLEIASTTDILQKLGIHELIADYIANIVNQLFNLSWSSGIQILIFLSGLQSIPRSYYEVAQCEGASGWETFWKVTFPSIGPMIVVNLVYTMYNLLINDSTMAKYIQDSVHNLDYSYASTMSIISAAAWMLLIGLVFYLVNRRVHYAVK